MEDIKIPRTRESGFKPFFIRPYRKASYGIDDLVIAIYQGGCSIRDVTRTMEILLEHRYSASWVARMTDVIYGEGRGLPAQKNRAMVSLVFLDGLVLEIRRDSVASEMVYVALGS